MKNMLKFQKADSISTYSYHTIHKRSADANSDVANDANTTGATYSVNNYFTMVCAVINYALGGK